MAFKGKKVKSYEFPDEDAVIPCSNFKNLEETGVFQFLPERESVFCLQFTIDGKYLIVTYLDGSVDVLDVSGKPKVYKSPMRRKYGELPFMCARNHPKQKDMFFLASSRGIMFSCNIHDDRKEASKEVLTEQKNEIHTFDFSLDGSEFATGGKDLAVRLYDTESCQLIKTWEGFDSKKPQNSKIHGQRIFCLKYLRARDEKWYQTRNPRNTFVTGGWDNHIKIWDSRIKQGVTHTIPGPHICGDSIDFWDFKILTGSWKQSEAIEIFDLRYLKKMHTLPFQSLKKDNVVATDSPRIGSAGGSAARISSAEKPSKSLTVEQPVRVASAGTSGKLSPGNRVSSAGSAKAAGEYVYSCRFYDGDTVLAGGSGTESTQAISISKNEVISESKQGYKDNYYSSRATNVLCLDVFPGERYAFAGNSDLIHIGKMS